MAYNLDAKMPRERAGGQGALGDSAGAAGAASEPGRPALVWPLMGFSDKPLGLLRHRPGTPSGILATRAPPFGEHRLSLLFTVEGAHLAWGWGGCMRVRRGQPTAPNAEGS